MTLRSTPPTYLTHPLPFDPFLTYLYYIHKTYECEIIKAMEKLDLIQDICRKLPITLNNIGILPGRVISLFAVIHDYHSYLGGILPVPITACVQRNRISQCVSQIEL